MSKIDIDLGKVRTANAGLQSSGEAVTEVKDGLGKLRYRIPSEIAQRHRIKERLQNTYVNLEKIENKINEIYNVVNSCVEQYSEAEQKNSRNMDAFE